MNRKKLYVLVLILCGTGYVWLAMNIAFPGSMPGICPFSTATGVPCPACGSMRAVEHLCDGEVARALYVNPLGVMCALLGVILPVWIIADMAARSDTFFRFYVRAEEVFLRKTVLALFILAVGANWLWNIYKHFNTPC